MACQGCGQISETKLCCPTCIELGHTTFFCGQECFSKNWAAHNRVHEELRAKKRAAAESDAGAAQEVRPTGGGSSSSSSSSSASRPVANKEPYNAYPRGMGAPLPGGMPLVGNFAKQKHASSSAGASKKSDDGANVGQAGLLGSFVDQAMALFASQSQAGSLTSSIKSRVSGKEQDGPSRRTGLRERSPSMDRTGPSAAGSQKGAQPKGRPAFSMQTGLWALVAFTVLAGGVLYLQQRRFEEAAGGGQAALTAAAAAAINPTASPSSEEEKAVVVAAEETGSRGASAASAGTAVAGAIPESVRAELASLRELVDKHEKMLRYVMDRYVEKDLRISDSQPASGVQAPVVHFAQPESSVQSGAEAKTEARAGDAPRKRKGGVEDVSMGADAVGVAQPEASQAAG